MASFSTQHPLQSVRPHPALPLCSRSSDSVKSSRSFRRRAVTVLMLTCPEGAVGLPELVCVLAASSVSLDVHLSGGGLGVFADVQWRAQMWHVKLSHLDRC